MGGNMSINRYLNYEETGKRLKEVRERGSMTIEELSLVIGNSFVAFKNVLKLS